MLSRWGYVSRASPRLKHPSFAAQSAIISARRYSARSFWRRTLRRVTYGFSFAGGLALMAEALGGVSDLLVVGVPRWLG